MMAGQLRWSGRANRMKEERLERKKIRDKSALNGQKRKSKKNMIRGKMRGNRWHDSKGID